MSLSSGKKRADPSLPDSDHAFQQVFLTCLQAVSDPAIRRKATEDLKDIFRYRVDSSSRIHLVLGLISKIIEIPQKGYSRPEIIRSLGIFCEIFEDKLIDFLPKIIQILLECLHDEDPELHEPIRDSFGKIAKHILSNLPLPAAEKETHVLLRNLWTLCGDGSRYPQIGSALCISKILQGVRGEILHDSVERISLKLTELLEKPDCKATLQLLECIMSLLVSVDDNASQLENSAKIVLPSVVQNISNSEWNVRKLALEIVYLLTALAGETLEVFRDELIDIVEQSRYDKVKSVQEMAVTTSNGLKNLREVPQEKLGYARNTAGSRVQNRSSQRNSSHLILNITTIGQKERPSETNSRPSLHKELERKRPGILKDSSYINSPMTNYRPETVSELQNKQAIRDRIAISVPYSTRNQPTLSAEPSLARLYSPNGLSQVQYNNYARSTTNDPLKQSKKLAESGFLKKPETATTPGIPEQEEYRKSYNPPKSSEKNTMKTTQSAAFFKDPRVDMSVENVSTRQFTGEGDKEGSKPSASSSPMIQELSRAELLEIINQLKTINQQQARLMEGMDRLQISTQDELSFVKTRLSQLEGVVGKLYTQHKDTLTSNRSSAIYNSSFLVPFQPYSRGSERNLDISRDIDSSKIHASAQRLASPVQALMRGEVMEENRGSTKNLTRRKEDSSRKLQGVKAKRPLLWMRLDEMVKKRNFGEAYDLCLEEGDEDAIICLVKDTGPIVDKLKSSTCELLLNKIKLKLFDETARPILIEVLERALLLRVSLSKQTLISLQNILGQTLETHKDSEDKQRIRKIMDYLGYLIEKQKGQEERKEADPKRFKK